jgi:hypothetical protein
MVSFGMIVVDILMEELPEVSLAQRNDVFQAFSSDRTDETLCGVQVRASRWQPHATHTAAVAASDGMRVYTVGRDPR